MSDWINWLIGAIIVGFVIVKFSWLIATPSSDGPRIKRDYESGERRVLSIKQAGFEWGGRSSPSYRKYEVVVQNPLGGASTYLVGVQADAWSDAELKQYDRFGS